MEGVMQQRVGLFFVPGPSITVDMFYVNLKEWIKEFKVSLMVVVTYDRVYDRVGLAFAWDFSQGVGLSELLDQMKAHMERTFETRGEVFVAETESAEFSPLMEAFIDLKNAYKAQAEALLNEREQTKRYREELAILQGAVKNLR
ncbi:MAG: hypothetical protein A3F53_02100 [Candidatus Zambryskibacteria bacterium RIFCSPHIGHO2_12_FULL_48_10]|nr:MAG: hypothetical protein A3F53_02100 [Candidatus Zambryskibacteria bacterium RIFCSPHIGHO2_12_FULL_48_10]OHB06814.1 MAG: hypothetical protein A3A31_00710 [Candidatus Zambryskibacteria bacterium RIFCSPLOWO2_01_FULL_48_25]